MKRYERVTTKDWQNHAMTVLLEVTGETDRWLTGFEVDAEGVRKSGKDFDERKHIIDKGTITRRTELFVSRHYGTLGASA